MNVRESNSVTIKKFYTEHLDELRSYVKNKVRDSEAADDIVQNVFIRLLSFDGDINGEKLSNLAYSIAHNMVCDYFKHKKCESEYAVYVYSMPDRDSCYASPAYAVSELMAILECGISRLNEGQRRVYKMNVYEGLAVSEISKTLKMNYKSVENRLGSARKAIRKYVTMMLA